MLLLAPCAVGDLLDRITILTIKVERVSAAKRPNVARELAALREAWNGASLPPPDTVPEYAELLSVNGRLWAVEDRLRAAEARRQFGEDFVADARSVYRENDRRAALKRTVSERFGSAIIEEKQHPASGGLDA